VPPITEISPTDPTRASPLDKTRLPLASPKPLPISTEPDESVILVPDNSTNLPPGPAAEAPPAIETIWPADTEEPPEIATPPPNRPSPAVNCKLPPFAEPGPADNITEPPVGPYPLLISKLPPFPILALESPASKLIVVPFPVDISAFMLSSADPPLPAPVAINNDPAGPCNELPVLISTAPLLLIPDAVFSWKLEPLNNFIWPSLPPRKILDGTPTDELMPAETITEPPAIPPLPAVKSMSPACPFKAVPVLNKMEPLLSGDAAEASDTDPLDNAELEPEMSATEPPTCVMEEPPIHAKSLPVTVIAPPFSPPPAIWMEPPEPLSALPPWMLTLPPSRPLPAASDK
jgi:hypothetical protein